MVGETDLTRQLHRLHHRAHELASRRHIVDQNAIRDRRRVTKHSPHSIRVHQPIAKLAVIARALRLDVILTRLVALNRNLEIVLDGAAIMKKRACRDILAITVSRLLPQVIEVLTRDFAITLDSIDNPNVSTEEIFSQFSKS